MGPSAEDEIETRHHTGAERVLSPPSAVRTGGIPGPPVTALKGVGELGVSRRPPRGSVSTMGDWGHEQRHALRRQAARRRGSGDTAFFSQVRDADAHAWTGGGRAVLGRGRERIYLLAWGRSTSLGRGHSDVHVVSRTAGEIGKSKVPSECGREAVSLRHRAVTA